MSVLLSVIIQLRTRKHLIFSVLPLTRTAIVLLIEWLRLIRISILQTLQNIIGRTKYSNLSHMLFSRSQPRAVLYPGETVLLQKHLLKQRHHKQILRFRHHLVRTLLLLCCHLIQTLCWQRYQGQIRCRFRDIIGKYQSVPYLRLANLWQNCGNKEPFTALSQYHYSICQ